MVSKEIAAEIKDIFDQNQLTDLKRFLKKRHTLNSCNAKLVYLFHLIQSAGILTTTIAAGYNQRYLIWVGVGLNILASLIDVYEKTNNNILKKLLADINKIKEGNYIDESPLIDTGDKPAPPPMPDTTTGSLTNKMYDMSFNPL
jgi:hypothetical protein